MVRTSIKKTLDWIEDLKNSGYNTFAFKDLPIKFKDNGCFRKAVSEEFITRIGKTGKDKNRSIWNIKYKKGCDIKLAKKDE